MTSKVTTITVRRNTALTMKGVVEQPVVAMARDDTPEGSWLFGFDPGDMRNEHWVFAADGEATREANQHFAEPFYLVTWAAKRIALQSEETSEASPHARVILIDPNGETLSFVSLGVLASLDLIRSLRGDGPYDPPIPVLVTEAKTRHGFRVYKLRIKPPEVAAPAKK